MDIANDYFLLYHGTSFTSDKIIEHFKLEDKNLSLYALILVVSRKKFEKFTLLPSFPTLCEELSIPPFKNLEQLYEIQYAIINFLNSKEQIAVLQNTFSTLMEEGVLHPDNYKKLISLFEYKESSKKILQHKNSENFSFQEEKGKLLSFIDLLDQEVDRDDFREEILSAKEYLQNQKFSIGITGVMNAGKSTMINALMGRDVLGSSVVPETANLTLLKYAQNEEARVFYWNKKEWAKVLKSAEQIESMSNFVSETEDRFGDTLVEYIKEDSRVDSVDVDRLAEYTSAKYSDKRCNLIKYVELKTDLNFLQDGVEIVDTPGLDDPVIQREEITKEYISRCDMMLHLMNVAQSATQKDVSFIIDAVLYQNISKLLIIITRADTVSKDELNEVISYTKESIKMELEAQNKGSKLNYILETIEFIAISGKMALECRAEPEKAKMSGFSLEESGILEVESYLQENLFGSSSKRGELIVKSSQNQLKSLVEKIQNYLAYSLEISSKTEEELQQKWKVFQDEKHKEERLLKQILEEINSNNEMLRGELRSLENFLTSEALDLQNVLQQRVVSDVKYSYEKSKKIPKASRTTVIVETAIKDGVIDIVRDYRYKLGRKFEDVVVSIYEKYKRVNLHTKLDGKVMPFDANIFFEEAFQSGFLTQSNDIFVQKVLHLVENSKPKEMQKLNKQLQEITKEYIDEIADGIRLKSNELTLSFIDKLILELKEPLKEREKELEREEASLKEYLDDAKNGGDRANNALDIHKKMKKINQLREMLIGVEHE